MIKRIIINICLVAILCVLMTAIRLPNSAQSQIDAARNHHYAWRWEEARVAYENAIALAPLSSEYLIEYGDFLWDMSVDLDSDRIFNMIAPIYKRAVSLNLKCAQCWIKQGHIQFATGEVDEAIASFKEALDRDPRGGDTSFYLREAALLLLEKDPKYYDEFVELTGNFASTAEGKKRVAEILN